MTDHTPLNPDDRTPPREAGIRWTGDGQDSESLRLTAARLDAAYGLVPAPDGLSDRILAASLVDLRAIRDAETAIAGQLDRAWDIAPDHLTPAIVAASAPGLPAAEPVPAVLGRVDGLGAAAIVRGPRSRTIRRAQFGRLAMAASFGILALTGMWATVGLPSGGSLDSPIVAAAEAPPDLGSMLVALDVGEDDFASLAALDAEMAFLEAGDALSMASVEQEIRSLLPDVLLMPSG